MYDNEDDDFPGSDTRREEEQRQADTAAEELQAETLQAEEDQQRADDQRRAEDQRREDFNRQDDQRREDDRKAAYDAEYNQRQDDLKAWEESQRQAEAAEEHPEELDEPQEENDERQDTLADMRAQHQADILRHRQAEEAKAADAHGQPQASFYKGGYEDIHGNRRDARDVEALLEHDKVWRAQEAQRQEAARLERMGAAPDAPGGNDPEPSNEAEEKASTESATVAPSREDALSAEINRVNAQGYTAEAQDTTVYMDMTDAQAESIVKEQRAVAVAASYAGKGAGSIDESAQGMDMTDEQADTLVMESDRVNTEGAQAEEQPPVDYAQRMQEAEEEAQRRQAEEQAQQGRGGYAAVMRAG